MATMLQDGAGNTSSMRIMMVTTVVTGCVVAIVGIILDRNAVELAALVGALLIPAFGGKAIQSRAGQ